MDEPQKSQFYPEWPHWARWAGLLAIWGTFFILNLIRSHPGWIASLLIVGLSGGLFGFLTGWPFRFRRGWRVDEQGVHEVLLPGRTVSYPWETIEAMEEEAPDWQQYMTALLPAERGPILCLRTRERTLRFGCFMKHWTDFVAQVRAGLKREDSPTATLEPPTAEAIASAFGMTTEEFPLVFQDGWQRWERWSLSMGAAVLFAVSMMMLKSLLRLPWKVPTPIFLGFFLGPLIAFLILGGMLAYLTLRHRRERVIVSKAGITLTDWRKRTRTYRWEDVLDAGETRSTVRCILWIRTPWSMLNLEHLREQDRLRDGLRRLLDARQQPPPYPVGVPTAPETALSRVTPPTAPEPTEKALSRSEAQPPERLTEAVEEATDEASTAEAQTVQTRSTP